MDALEAVSSSERASQTIWLVLVFLFYFSSLFDQNSHLRSCEAPANEGWHPWAKMLQENLAVCLLFYRRLMGGFTESHIFSCCWVSETHDSNHYHKNSCRCSNSGWTAGSHSLVNPENFIPNFLSPPLRFLCAMGLQRNKALLQNRWLQGFQALVKTKNLQNSLSPGLVAFVYLFFFFKKKTRKKLTQKCNLKATTGKSPTDNTEASNILTS